MGSQDSGPGESKNVCCLTITNLDAVGELMESDTRLYRKINLKYQHLVLDLFNSGFINELITKGLFVESRLLHEGGGIVVEHKRLTPVIYPHEWSFAMLRDAAIAVLEVGKIAEKFGYSMKDCHSWNVVFSNGKAVYVDLGSFVKMESELPEFPFQEFLESYYYPLFLWEVGLEHSVRFSLLYKAFYPTCEFLLFRYKFLRFASRRLLKRFVSLRVLLYRLRYVSDSKVEERLASKGEIVVLFVKLFKKVLMSTGVFLPSLNKLRDKISKLHDPRVVTEWEGYYGEGGKLTNRFNKILSYTNTICRDSKTAISFGANQGFFENILLEQSQLTRIICQDSDSKALDSGYRKYGSRIDGKEMCFANFDVCMPISHSYMIPSYQRFNSDIIYALALTHHLILRAGFRLGHILGEFDKQCGKYVFIEFMPLGLWVPGAKVTVPDWYTVDYFRKEFVLFFDLINEEQLEENRILFVGAKKAKA